MLVSLAVVALAGAAATGRAALLAAACRSRDAPSCGSAGRSRAAYGCVQAIQHSQWRTNGRVCKCTRKGLRACGTACAAPISSFATTRSLATGVLLQQRAQMGLYKHQLPAHWLWQQQLCACHRVYVRPQARRKRLSETLLTSHRSPNSATPAGNAARRSAAPWHWAALPLLPHLAFGCFAPHMARTRGASGELSIYLFYLLYLFYTPARASCRAACGAGCPRPPLCAAAVDAGR